MMGSHAPRFVGSDVGKAHLDLALLPDATSFRVRNDEEGWAELIARIAGEQPPTIVLDATGAYHVGVTLALAEAGMPPAVMNPEQPHAFIRSEGQRTTPGRTDARLLARVGQQKQPSPSPVLTHNARELKELVACRDDFTKLLTMEKNRLHVATDRTRNHHQAMIDALLIQRRSGARARRPHRGRPCARCPEPDRPVDAGDRGCPRAGVPGRARGVGPGRPEGPGVAGRGGPHTQQRGARQARGAIRGGRVTSRKALYQMAVTAVTRNPVMKGHFRHRLVRMPYKVAIIACARRMLGILNAMVREGLTWPETKVGQAQFLPMPLDT